MLCFYFSKYLTYEGGCGIKLKSKLNIGSKFCFIVENKPHTFEDLSQHFRFQIPLIKKEKREIKTSITTKSIQHPLIFPLI